jgi:hypothetical protein
MKDKAAGLYSNVEIRQLQDVDPASYALFSNSPKARSVLVSPLAKFRDPHPSLDIRLREELRPVISDRNTLKPEQYHAMLQDTHFTLLKQIKNEKEEEAKEALRSLINLLEENAALRSLLDQYMNHIQLL